MKIKTSLLATLMITGLIRLEAGQIQYSYDENDQVVAVNVNNETAASYEYDPARNLLEHDVVSKPGGLKSFILYFTKYSGTEKILRWIGLRNTDSASS